MSAEDLARERLAAAQSAFLQALAGGGTVPEGFNAERIRVAGQSLAAKRMRSVARAWPALTAMLGDTFASRFASFAAANPLPRQGGPLADGRAFARTLAPGKWGRFANTWDANSDKARLEIMAVDLHYRSTRHDGGLVPKRWPAIRMGFLPKARRGVLAIRLPFGGEHWLSVPLPWL